MLLLALLIASEGEMGWAETYLNYPGLEGWKFINLAIFLVAGAYLLGDPLKSALRARREGIQKLLANADAERDAAQIRLTETETLLARVDSDVAAVRERVKVEAQLERDRLNEATQKEIEKMRQQGHREIESAAKLARRELQKFLANRSVELARESVRTEIRPEDDSRLIDEDIGQLRRAQA
jgi:F0F1-type ATP synthase membrane subunit b/b'